MSGVLESAEKSGNMAAVLVVLNCNIANRDSCENGLKSLRRLLEASLDVGENPSSISATIYLCLNNYADDSDIVEIVFDCIHICASKSTIMQNLLCTTDMVGVLIDAMNSHSRNVSIQEKGCRVVFALANDSDANCEELLSQKVGKVLDRAADRIPKDGRKNYSVLAKEALRI